MREKSEMSFAAVDRDQNRDGAVRSGGRRFSDHLWERNPNQKAKI